MSNFYLEMEIIAARRREYEKSRVYPTREEEIQREAIAIGRECKMQQYWGLIPRHSASDCYDCQQFENRPRRGR